MGGHVITKAASARNDQLCADLVGVLQRIAADMPVKGASTTDEACGSRRGYRRHQMRRETACDPCKAGAAAYEQERQRDLQAGDPRMVDGSGPQRRIRALVCMGWAYGDLATRLGWHVGSVERWARGHRQKMPRALAAQVRGLYADLHMTPGPSQRARDLALSYGWAAPMAWDDIDADEEPEGVRQPRGQRVAGVAAVWDDLRWDDVDHLRSYGVPDDQIAERFGITLDAMQRAENRYGRTAGTPAA